MAPRRHMLLLLSALALLLSPLALVPMVAQAAGDYIVNTTDDLPVEPGSAAGTYCKPSGVRDCSLRRAIAEANGDGIASEIFFEVTGTFTITGTVGLQISAPNLTIDARPAPPATGIRVRIEGGGAAFPGLRITSSNVRIYGLSITGFTDQFAERGAGIQIDGAGATGNTISANHIGVLPNGTATAANLYGVILSGDASGNTITGNLIGGNTNAGVLIENADNNTVSASGIGIGVDQVGNPLDLGNGQAGVIITSPTGQTTTGNIIGGTSSGAANTISGNGPDGRTDRAGILLSGVGTTGNFIRVNRVGLNVAGILPEVAVPNSGDGIRIDAGASNNTIGGMVTPLVISGNANFGIRITGSGTVSNTVSSGVYVGLNGDRNAALANTAGGISVDSGATLTTISNSTIAGHSSNPGVLISGAGASGTTITGSYIGRVPEPGGTGAFLSLPNRVGVQLAGAGRTSIINTTIGNNAQEGVLVQGTSPVTISASTIISNTQVGVRLEGASGSLVSTSVISGNLTGVLLRGATGTGLNANTIAENSAGGLLLETVGLSLTTGTSLDGNTISGNGQYGLRLSGALTTTMRRNYVGLDVPHTDRLPNRGNGIEVFDSRNTNATDTYVGGNELAGIVISGTGTLSTTFNNTVGGLSSNGSAFIVGEPNGGPAVRVTGGARQTTISGGSLGGAGAAPTDPPGVLIEGPSTMTVTVTGARIGWVPSNTTPSAPPLPYPFGLGISVNGPVANVQILTNTIRYNKGAGVFVTGDADRVRITDNRLSRNGAGITLDQTSLLTARPPLTDNPSASQSKPNHDIDPPPVDVTAFADPLRLHVYDSGVVEGYVITSTNRTEAGLSPVSACVTCTIHIYRPGPDGEATSGQGYEPVVTFPTGGSSGSSATSFLVPDNGRFSRQILGGIGSISELLLVATDGFGNSSEYVAFPVSTGFSLTNLSGPTSRAPGDVVTYTLRLSNTGTLDVTGLRLQTQGTLKDWGVATSPVTNTVFTLPTPLEAGSSRLITVTLTLPRGSNPNVQAGLVDRTIVRVVKDSSTLSQSVQLETTVLPQPVLVVSPTVSLGSAKPTETVPHTHVIRNDGNVTVTLGITETTIDDVGATGLWVTTVNTRSFTVGPGGEARVRVEVTVPSGAQVEKPGGGPVQAVTYVTATVPLSPTGGFGPVTAFFSDTTRVDIDPDALITDGNQEQDGAANQPTVFRHFVQNLSNKASRFCFVWSTNQGSTVTFRAITDNFVIDSNGCFTLDTVTDIQARRFQQAQFEVRVLVDRRALPDSVETLNLTVREETTKVIIGSATVNNRINVIYGLLVPRIWMPALRR